MSFQEVMIEQGSDEWLNLRKNKIGSSDAAVIMKVSKWDTPYSLWCKKLDLLPQQTENSAMTRGKILEPIARERLEQKLGVTLLPKVFIKDFMIASLDAIDSSNQVIVEIKHPNINDHRLAMDRIVPDHYYPQLQHQMSALNVNEMWYSSNHDIGTADFIVKKDEEFCDIMLTLERQFFDNLQNFESPKLCDKDYLERTDAEWLEKVLQWKKINANIKELEELENQLKKDIMTMTGGRNTKGAGIKVSSSTRKGAIDYSLIPELMNVDVENYRKQKIIVWKLSEI